MTLITCSFQSLSKYFSKPLREMCGYGNLLKKHFCCIYCQAYFWFLSQTFDFSESGSLTLHKCVKEPHSEKTCICKEIKSIIVVNIFSVSCVCFKEIFSVHYGKCIQLIQNETSDKHENSVFCDHHLRQSPVKCTVQKNLF